MCYNQASLSDGVMKMPRGDTQERIYEFIKQTIELKGYPPSVREICEAVHLSSTSTVHGHLARLEKRGLIRRDPTKPRAIEVIEQTNARGKVVPVVGRVPAGRPVLAVEDIEDYMMVPRELASNGEYFALRVHGESMVNAGILSGDYVIVRKQPDAESGEIVVALVDGEDATLKRFCIEDDGRIRLQPENDFMEPIYPAEVKIVGKAVGLFRKL